LNIALSCEMAGRASRAAQNGSLPFVKDAK
jgi:hypothetical protein